MFKHLQRDLTNGTQTPACPVSILIITSGLRKPRSRLRINAVAFGNRAIALLRPVIPPKSFVANRAGRMPQSKHNFSGAENLLERLTRNTVKAVMVA